MTKEQRFFNALRDVFVGARVEGQSGFINLMRIKSRYYEEGVFPRLREDIDRALEPFPEFREELFDRLYAFSAAISPNPAPSVSTIPLFTNGCTNGSTPMTGMWRSSGRPTCSTTSRPTVSS